LTVCVVVSINMRVVYTTSIQKNINGVCNDSCEFFFGFYMS